MRLILAVSALLAATVAAAAQTPSWLPPADSARCPSKWGAGDERASYRKEAGDLAWKRTQGFLAKHMKK